MCKQIIYVRQLIQNIFLYFIFLRAFFINYYYFDGNIYITSLMRFKTASNIFKNQINNIFKKAYKSYS